MKFLLSILFSIAVAACGGGGGSISQGPHTSEGSVASPVTLTASPHSSQVSTTNSYYTYTVPWTGSYKVAITALSADVDLYVYTNTAFTTPASCNPDNTFKAGTASEDCTVAAVTGQVLYIKANGSYTTNGASFNLAVTTTTPQPPAGPAAEGSVVSPVVLTAAPRSSQVDRTFSYYQYTAPNTGSYKVAITGMSDDVDLYVYTDAGFTMAAACSPNNTLWIGLTSEDCTVSATAGQVLYIKVNGFYTTNGATYTLGVSAVAATGLVAEGSVASPIVVTTSSPRSSQVNLMRSYYKYTAPSSGSYKVSITGLSGDVDLYVYTDAAFTTLATCNPNNTFLGGTAPEDCTVSVTAGQVLYIMADGSWTVNGATFTLSVDPAAAPAPATTIAAMPYNGSITTATMAFYSYTTVGSVGTVQLNNMTDDVDVAISDPTFTFVDTNWTCTMNFGVTPDTCTATTPVPPGTVLHIVIGNFTVAGATFTLNVAP